MATTKDQILNQQDAPEVAAPADAQPKQHNNGGTAPTGNDGTEPPVNDGSAVVGNNVSPDGDSDSGAVVKAPQPTSYAEQPKDAPVVPSGGATAPKAAPTTPAAAPAKGGEAPSTTTTTTTSQAAEGTPRMSYVEMFQKMSPYKPPTEEELEKERKKEKRDKIFAAIGDGIAALSNLFSTTHGAPNAYDPNNSLSAKAKERWDKLKKERDENGRYYTAAYMQAMKNDEEGARDDRNWRRQLQRDKRQDDVDDRNWNRQLQRDKRQDEVDDRTHQFRVDESERQQGNWKAQFDEGKRQYDQNFKEGQRQFDKNFKEGQRQFDANKALQQLQLAEQRRHNTAEEGLQREQMSMAREGQYTNMVLSDGSRVRIKTSDLTSHNIAYVFNKVPSVVAGVHKPTPTKDLMTQKIIPVSSDEMLQYIGAYMATGGDADVIKAWKQVGGSYEAAPPSRQNDNTPPSRRR